MPSVPLKALIWADGDQIKVSQHAQPGGSGQATRTGSRATDSRPACRRPRSARRHRATSEQPAPSRTAVHAPAGATVGCHGGPARRPPDRNRPWPLWLGLDAWIASIPGVNGCGMLSGGVGGRPPTFLPTPIVFPRDADCGGPMASRSRANSLMSANSGAYVIWHICSGFSGATRPSAAPSPRGAHPLRATRWPTRARTDR
jgi:hypothetical protein